MNTHDRDKPNTPQTVIVDRDFKLFSHVNKLENAIHGMNDHSNQDSRDINPSPLHQRRSSSKQARGE